MIDKGVQSNFVITGWQTKTQICDLYRQHIGLILPSQDEGMPNVVLEAMSCGLVIIATDTAGTNELLNGNGWLIPIANVPELTKALTAALTTLPDEMTALRRRSREIALTYQWEKMALQHLDLMSSPE